jgi:threonine dehydratase
VTAAQVIAAAVRLRGIVRETPCDATSGDRVRMRTGMWYLKREDLQRTGSFKERGAAHALACLAPAERRRGVVAASAGNHALGLAWHGRHYGVPVTLVMPEAAARVKVARCRALGAHVVLAGDSYAAAEVVARERAKEQRARFVHPFEDPDVIAGQGTVAAELLRQVPAVGTVVVPVGGGGLLAGVLTVVRALRPDVRVVAVEPAAAPKLTRALASRGPVNGSVQPTLADGLAVARLGHRAFAAMHEQWNQVVTVTEEEIAAAMLHLFEQERITAEGAGAVALAALLSGRVESDPDRAVVAIVSGANVDARTFARALEGASVALVTAPTV